MCLLTGVVLSAVWNLLIALRGIIFKVSFWRVLRDILSYIFVIAVDKVSLVILRHFLLESQLIWIVSAFHLMGKTTTIIVSTLYKFLIILLLIILLTICLTMYLLLLSFEIRRLNILLTRLLMVISLLSVIIISPN